MEITIPQQRSPQTEHREIAQTCRIYKDAKVGVDMQLCINHRANADGCRCPSFAQQPEYDFLAAANPSPSRRVLSRARHRRQRQPPLPQSRPIARPPTVAVRTLAALVGSKKKKSRPLGLLDRKQNGARCLAIIFIKSRASRAHPRCVTMVVAAGKHGCLNLVVLCLDSKQRSLL